MAKATSTRNCPRQLQTREIARSCAGFDPVESTLLTLVRFFAESFAMPQSTNAFKKALDKITNVYQSRTSSGMQWHGIQPVLQF